VLVLTRKQNEEVVIQLGRRVVRVRVVGAGNGRVRLGIDAPPEVAIHREEIWSRIRQWKESESTAQFTPD